MTPNSVIGSRIWVWLQPNSAWSGSAVKPMTL